MSADVLTRETARARDTLLDLEQTLRQLPDADLHRADPEGGWTCAQLVSHIHLSGLLWIADLQRLQRHPQSQMFMYREEVGHDALGAPPHSSREAADRIVSVRTALEACLPAVDPAVLDKSLEVPTLGTFTVAAWMPLIIGHLDAHAEQIKAILRVRGALPGAGAAAVAGRDL